MGTTAESEERQVLTATVGAELRLKKRSSSSPKEDEIDQVLVDFFHKINLLIF